MNPKKHSSKLLSLMAGLLLPGLLSAPVSATPLDIPGIPLFLALEKLYPNLVLTLDDSGSMRWGSVPDDINGDDATNRYKSSYFNAMYYNPALVYTPPPKYNGTSCDLDTNPATCYPNVDPGAAPRNGFDTTRGTVDLETDYWATARYDPSDTTQTNAGSPSGGSDRTYYAVTGASSTTTYSQGPITCQLDFDNNGSSDRLQIETSSTDCFTTLFTDLAAGAVITVTGDSGSGERNGTYTVTSVNTSSKYIYVGNPWTTDRNDKTVTLSWTRTVTTAPSTFSAYYYLFYTQAGVSRPSSCTSTVADQKTDDDCYVKVVVGSSDDIAGTSSSVITAEQQELQSEASTPHPWTAAQKMQNFANWYSYYRTRNLSTASSAMRAFTGVDGDVRVAWQALYSSSSTGCNSFSDSCKGWDGNAVDSRIRRLDSVLAATPTSGRTHRQELYDWLARFPIQGSTPLRGAAKRAGDYFTGTVDIHHPYAQDPQISSGTHYSCRRNIHLMMTDGGWCGGTSDLSSFSPTDPNSNTVTLPEPWPGDTSSPYQWTPGAPYSDGQGTNLADLAFYYWSTDLQTGLDNNVAPITRDLSGGAIAQWENPRNDPATWQHLSTYTVGVGLRNTLSGTRVDGGSGSLPIWQGGTFLSDPTTHDGYFKLSQGTGCPSTTDSSTTPSPYCWPYTNTTEGCSPSALNQQYKVYDLWHAAISGRGEFFSAESPQDIVDAFNAVLGQVKSASTSFSSLAANSTSLESDSQVFQAKFDSRDWSGSLLAFDLGAGASISAKASWDAALKVPVPASRNIFTYDATATAGVVASCAAGGDLTFALNSPPSGSSDGLCVDRLAWIKGDHSKEVRNGGTLRDRLHSIEDVVDADGDGNLEELVTDVEWVLGDVVSSDPVFVWKEDFGYGSLSGTEGSSYASFVSGKANESLRRPMLYIGGNDGMLHGFVVGGSVVADKGKEKFAYIPTGVYGKLNQLMEPSYSHTYLVNGSPTVGDAYIGSGWKSVLVGALGAGGRTVYALDVSEPENFDATKIMWEFMDSDMGLGYSQPQIGRLASGKWVAVFGNGYNSPNEQAMLYIVNLEDPTDFKKLPMGCSACGNGLSTPLLVDTDGDKNINQIYAGDLLGNMWRVDVGGASSSDVASDAAIQVSFGGDPLFLRNDANYPITAQPAVDEFASGGMVVLFGTGRYLIDTDKASTTGQAFYGIIDNGSGSALTRSDLLAQSVTLTTTLSGTFVRTSSDNTLTTEHGWYLDFPTATGAAERSVSRPLVYKGKVFFVTIIPSTDPCVPGGESWIWALNTQSGGEMPSVVWDIGGDDVFDDADRVGGTGGEAPSGVKLGGLGLVSAPTLMLDKSSGIGHLLLSGTEGTGSKSFDDPTAGNPPTRVYWLEIR